MCLVDCYVSCFPMISYMFVVVVAFPSAVFGFVVCVCVIPVVVFACFFCIGVCLCVRMLRWVCLCCLFWFGFT